MFELSVDEVKSIEEGLSSIVCPVCGKSGPVTIKMAGNSVFAINGHCCPERYKLLVKAFNENRERLVQKHKRDFMNM